MSLKDDIQSVKQELSTEESFLESFLKIEKFYKKYKFALIGGVGAIVLGIIGFYSLDYIQTQKTIEANKAFNLVLKEPSNKDALFELKQKDENLYKIALMLQDNTQKSENKLLDQLTQYSQAIQKDDITALSTLTQSQDFLLKDLALFNRAVIEAKNGKYKEAKATLSLIPKDSNIQSFSKMLEHFLLTK